MESTGGLALEAVAAGSETAAGTAVGEAPAVGAEGLVAARGAVCAVAEAVAVRAAVEGEGIADRPAPGKTTDEGVVEGWEAAGVLSAEPELAAGRAAEVCRLEGDAAALAAPVEAASEPGSWGATQPARTAAASRRLSDGRDRRGPTVAGEADRIGAREKSGFIIGGTFARWHSHGW